MHTNYRHFLHIKRWEHKALITSWLHSCRWYCCPHFTGEENKAVRGRRSMRTSHGAGSQRRLGQTQNPRCPLLPGPQRDDGSSRLGAEDHTSLSLPLCLPEKICSISDWGWGYKQGNDLRGPPQRRPGVTQPAFSAVEWSHEFLLPSVAWIIIKYFLGYTCLSKKLGGNRVLWKRKLCYCLITHV